MPLILNPASTYSDEQLATGKQHCQETIMSRLLKFVFRFPPIHGVFDAGYGVVYIFGSLHESEIENVIVHETLHYVLLRVVGKRASLKLDRIYSELDD
jgi:hypothetical protein